MTQRIVTFSDIETTGLNEPEHRIIEACSILYDLDTGDHLKSFVWRCNPERKIDIKAQRTHGIKLEDLANEPTWKVIAPAVAGSFASSALWVAHNGLHFDFPFIERELARVGIPVPQVRKFDTMVEGRFATPHGKNCTLGELARCLDVPYDPGQAHGAEYDVQVMAACFFEAKRLGWFNP